MNYCSNPSDLRITDMRFVDIDGAPKRCTILRIDTNQGISGFGEVRDVSSKTYALMLKSRILGENPLLFSEHIDGGMVLEFDKEYEF